MRTLYVILNATISEFDSIMSVRLDRAFVDELQADAFLKARRLQLAPELSSGRIFWKETTQLDG